jgi:hypothetical protein
LIIHLSYEPKIFVASLAALCGLVQMLVLATHPRAHSFTSGVQQQHRLLEADETRDSLFPKGARI